MSVDMQLCMRERQEVKDMLWMCVCRGRKGDRWKQQEESEEEEEEVRASSNQLDRKTDHDKDDITEWTQAQ